MTAASVRLIGFQSVERKCGLVIAAFHPKASESVRLVNKRVKHAESFLRSFMCEDVRKCRCVTFSPVH